VATIGVERGLLEDLLARRDGLVHALTAGVAAQDWKAVMSALDALLVALQRVQAAVEAVPPAAAEGLDRRVGKE
jgi:hypothetical protein